MNELKDMSGLTPFAWYAMSEEEFHATAAEIKKLLEALSAAKGDTDKFMDILMKLPLFMVREAAQAAALELASSIISITPLN